ncbi:hypothetical protein [Clostridium perfringens]|uniref:hypothetical protein n=1 Tax=Clostridium perfringens TaxID=1502 RepID=UPI002AC53875|nr:hypothetical protein [Clostridium perfringens]MDZ4991222.1 hypothetical protein [Clostridium perfringens]
MGNKKQTRITVNFRYNTEEQKLYKWIQEKGVVGGDSVFIKSILYKEYLKDKEGN